MNWFYWSHIGKERNKLFPSSHNIFQCSFCTSFSQWKNHKSKIAASAQYWTLYVPVHIFMKNPISVKSYNIRKSTFCIYFSTSELGIIDIRRLFLRKVVISFGHKTHPFRHLFARLFSTNWGRIFSAVFLNIENENKTKSSNCKEPDLEYVRVQHQGTSGYVIVRQSTSKYDEIKQKYIKIL